MSEPRKDLAHELTNVESDACPIYGWVNGKLEVYSTIWARWDGELPTKAAHHTLAPGSYNVEAMPKLKLIRPL